MNLHSVNRVRVDEDYAGQRLDNFLMARLKGVPKSYVYRIVRSGEVRVDSKRVDPSYRIQLGEEVRIPPVRQGKTIEGLKKVPSAQFSILYEDDALLAIDKPAGVAVHGGSGVNFGVIEQLRQARLEARFLELVHRLDRETSGILLIAKKRSALLGLHAMLREQKMRKNYYALVKGKWRDEKRLVQFPLLKYLTADGERRVRVDPAGLSSATLFYQQRVWSVQQCGGAINSSQAVSLLKAELLTGRTHQIRVHLSHLGFPIAGDEKYGDFSWNRELAQQGLRRMFLHAATIEFAHPLTHQTIFLEAPLPSQLVSWLPRVSFEKLA